MVDWYTELLQNETATKVLGRDEGAHPKGDR
jgi:hypothetical protein